MGMIQRNMEIGAVRREQSDLGGTITFTGADGTPFTMPCSMGMDTSGLQRADNTAGCQFNQLRRVVVRSDLLQALPNPPRSGDSVDVQGNMEQSPVTLIISPTNGIENMNAILTAFNLYNPNV